MNIVKKYQNEENSLEQEYFSQNVLDYTNLENNLDKYQENNYDVEKIDDFYNNYYILSILNFFSDKNGKEHNQIEKETKKEVITKYKKSVKNYNKKQNLIKNNTTFVNKNLRSGKNGKTLKLVSKK